MITYNNNPYYDDYDESKGFHQILFKPGYAVQARELTQLQSILQQQIERFGKHIFKEGSIVLGGLFNVDNKVDYVKITSSSTLTADQLKQYIGTTLSSSSNGVVAYVVDVADKDTWESSNHVMMIRYTRSGDLVSVFQPNETITCSNSLLPDVIVATTDPTGKGSLFTIDEGVVFSRGYFVAFAEQNIILDPTNDNPSCKIGFENYPSIVTSVEDETLLDNAQGSYNYAAPGADRLKLVPTLKRVEFDEVVTLPDFVTLFTVKDGNIQDIKERSEYAQLYDEFAKRTYDESGDYVVRGLGVIVREHLDTGSNEGYLTVTNGGDSDLLAIGIEPGLAYVKGHEVNNISTRYISTPKSTTYNTVNSEIISARSGNYVFVTEMQGNLIQDAGTNVNLYDTAEQRITNKINSAFAPTGNVIGTAKVKAVLYDSPGIYKLYILTTSMEDGYTFSDVRAVGTTSFFGDLVLESGKAVIKETTTGTSLLYPVGTSFIRSIRGESNTPDTTFSFRRTYPTNNVSAGGEFSITNSVLSESHAYGSTGTLDDTEKRSIIVSCNNDVTITLPGTVSGTSGTKNITGVSTYFTRLNPGDKISITGVSGYYTVDLVSSNTAMTVKENLDSTASGAAFTKVYLAGDIIDFTAKGSDAGEIRTITVTNDNTLAFDMKETISGLQVSASFNMVRNTALEIQKTRRSNRFVKIDCSSLSDLSSPINLGFSDVYQIRSIRKNGSAFVNETDGSDVTSSFRFDNGQRDQIYDHASITPIGSIISASDHLLVKLDYFAPDYTQGVGFFSVDSYDIDDTAESNTTIFTHQIPVYKSSFDGTTYNLRDYLDFRPVIANTANDSITIAGASTNPTKSTTLNMDISGLHIPLPSSQIICDYSYYLARRDVIVVDQDGNMSVVQGVPAVYPVSPKPSEQVMALDNVYVPPYPSLSVTYARILNKQSEGVRISAVYHNRFTMRDIGALAKRIENLEYYASLSLLEKEAVDLKILDENGLDRFKNGFFVDDFQNHLLGNTDSPDYMVAVDPSERVIRPYFEMDSLLFEYEDGTNTQATGNLVSLPYTERTLLEQPTATTVRNVHQSIYRFIGKVYANPEADTWIDTNTVDATLDFSGGLKPGVATSTQWGSWTTTGVSTGVSWSGNNRSNWMRYDKTYTAQQREGLATTTVMTAVQEQLGNLITDVSLQTYIRPQTIQLIGVGLKPNTQYYIFFDNENMTQYVRQGTVANFDITPGTNIFSNNKVVAAAGSIEGGIIKSNEFGELFCLLRLPADGKRFRTGTKEISISDTPNNNIDDATSYAITDWTAGGLAVQKQNTVVSTVVSEVSVSNVVDSRTLVSIRASRSSHGCTAYSFKVQCPEDQVGVYLTSVDIYVQSSHPTLGSWFEVREMDNAGGITTNQVPFSEVWYKAGDIPVSNDASIPFNVKFPSPLYLMKDKYYAFIIHTEATHPDLYVWFARLGENDVATGQPFNDRKMLGDTYVAHNNYNWVAVPDVALKCKMYFAEFTSLSGTANFVNKGYEFFTVTEPSTNYTQIGETITGSDIITLGTISASRDLIAGDKIVSGTKEAIVVAVNGLLHYTSYNGVDFTVNEDVTLLDASDVSLGTAKIVSVEYGEGQLYKYESNDNFMVISNSNGKFFEGSVLTGTSSSIESTVISFENYKYSTINFQPNHLELINTSCGYNVTGIISSTGLADAPVTLNANSTDSFVKEYIIRSLSDEIINYSGEKSVKLTATLQSGSDYTSPIIDLRRVNSVFVHNIVNDDVTGETGSGGNLLNKYISQTVTLAEGQDAEDLKVYLRAYMPQGSEVKVWMKIRNDEDGTIFDNRPWVELTNESAGLYSSTVDSNDFKEFTYSIPDELLTGAFGEVEYVSNGSTYTGFKQFAIKIGLLGTNSALVPRVGDLRVIALQK